MVVSFIGIHYFYLGNFKTISSIYPRLRFAQQNKETCTSFSPMLKPVTLRWTVHERHSFYNKLQKVYDKFVRFRHDRWFPLSFFSKRFKDVLLKLLTLQTLKRNLKQFRNSKINYKSVFNTLAPILPRSGGVSLMSMRASLSRWILNRAPFWTFFAVVSPSNLVVCTCRAVFFVKMSEESVIDCGDRLQGGIIVRKTI